MLDEYDDKSKYKDHVFEQYKLYVEMADRISARRSTANTFFLTLNTLLVGALSTCADKFSRLPVIVLCIAAIVLCYVWKCLINSYRQLNTAKYTVVGEFEESESPYGTFDQGGNVFEWNETAVDNTRGVRGGSFVRVASNMQGVSRFDDEPTNEFSDVGFRVAVIPEPATLALLLIGTLPAMTRRRSTRG